MAAWTTYAERGRSHTLETQMQQGGMTDVRTIEAVARNGETLRLLIDRVDTPIGEM